MNRAVLRRVADPSPFSVQLLDPMVLPRQCVLAWNGILMVRGHSCLLFLVRCWRRAGARVSGLHIDHALALFQEGQQLCRGLPSDRRIRKPVAHDVMMGRPVGIGRVDCRTDRHEIQARRSKAFHHVTRTEADVRNFLAEVDVGTYRCKGDAMHFHQGSHDRMRGQGDGVSGACQSLCERDKGLHVPS